MNAIQQISLKLQMGIPHDMEIQPQMLRAMWLELASEANDASAGSESASNHGHSDRPIMKPALD